MTAPACPKLAAAFYKEATGSRFLRGPSRAETETLFYLLGAIITGGWIEIDDTPQLEKLKRLPSWDAIKMYCAPHGYTQDELTAALVAIKLSA